MKKGLIILLFGMLAFLQAVPDVQAQFIDATPKTELYAEINAYRADHGLPALEVSESLEQSSALYAFKLHVLYGGERRHDLAWINRNKRKGVAELIGNSYKPMDWWKRSYTHNSVLLAKGFTKMGLAKYEGNYVLRVQRT